MKLLEFITYCTLKDYIRVHTEIEVPKWDPDAEKYFKIELQARGYSATIRYATIQDQAAIVYCSLFDHGGRVGTKIVTQPNLGDILKAFAPS